MAPYRKFVAVILGLAVLIGLRHLEIDIPGIEAMWLDLAVSALTAWGVYQSKNDPLPREPDWETGE